MIRVVIADDHHLVRQGIRSLLEKAADLQVVGEATDGQEAIELVQRLAPDVLVIDIAMPRLSGAEAIARVRALGVGTQVVILSVHEDETVVRQALRNGARGYLLKRSVIEELLLAIRAASQGEVYLSPTVVRYFVDDLPAVYDPGKLSAVDRLTPREREVLQLIVEGNSNSEIARKLKVSQKTVEKHRGNLMSKLEVHDTASIVRFAIKHDLVHLD